MLYMVIEEFRGGDAIPVYRRFRDSGRQLPDGVRYHDSWVTADMTRCFQVMECQDHAQLDEWMSRWQDLVRFEVVPIMKSTEAATRMASVI